MKSGKDRSITLMHILVDIVLTNFPDLLNVFEQLKFAESAAGGKFNFFVKWFKHIIFWGFKFGKVNGNVFIIFFD